MRQNDLDLSAIPEYSSDAVELSDEATPTTLPMPVAATLSQRVEKHRLLTLERGANARSVIARLPDPGEVIHVILDGTYDGCDIFAALVDLMGTVDEAHITSLGFSTRSAQVLLDLLDGGQVKTLSLVVSEMMVGHARNQTDSLATKLASRGGSLAIRRVHAKLYLLRSGDQRIVACGSQNLRRCSCYEQLQIFNDPQVYEHFERFAVMLAKGGI